MVKICKILCCVLMLFVFTACSEDTLSEHIIINGFGIDFDEYGYKITIRYAGLEELGQEEVMSVSGETVYEAMNNISLTTGKTPIYSSPSYLICSEEVAQNGLDTVLDFFSKFFKTKPTILLYISENSAEDILNIKDENDELISSDIIELITQSGANEKKTVSATVMSFVNDSLGESGSTLVPIISEENGIIFTEKTAVFDDFYMELILNEDETKGYLISTSELDSEVIVIEYEDDKKITVQIVDVISNFDKITDTEFILEIDATVNIISAPLTIEKLDYDIVENKIKVEIKNMVDLCTVQMLENSIDIYNLSGFLYLNYTEFWQENSDNFLSQLSELDVNQVISITFIKELENT